MVPRVQHVMSSTRSPNAQLVADEVQAAKITKSSPADTRSVSQSVTPFRPSIAISFLQTRPPARAPPGKTFRRERATKNMAERDLPNTHRPELVNIW